MADTHQLSEFFKTKLYFNDRKKEAKQRLNLQLITQEAVLTWIESEKEIIVCPTTAIAISQREEAHKTEFVFQVTYLPMIYKLE